MNPSTYYDRLIGALPMGAERTVLRVLTFHIGLAAAISKPDLLDACAQTGAKFSDERQLRLTIVKLRKAGIPVCSSSGDGGYYLAANYMEYREFRGKEYVAKIIDMRETVSAMDETTRQLFPDEYAAFKREQAKRAGQPAMV